MQPSTFTPEPKDTAFAGFFAAVAALGSPHSGVCVEHAFITRESLSPESGVGLTTIATFHELGMTLR
jgi:hypothetical protein